MGDNRQNLSYFIERGWGTEEGGTWMDDKYTLEMLFKDVMAGAVTFNCGDADEEGELELIKRTEQRLTVGNSGRANQQKITDEGDQKTLDELLSELDELIGLESVKKSIRENITYLNFTKMCKQKGFEDTKKISLHSIFSGNPCTGKTTVVKMLGKIYHQMGLLSKGHVLEVDRATLVGEFIGQTAPKTKKAIESARGGILFIDEAYSLARGDDDSKDFVKEVIEALLKEMSGGPGDFAIIGAGYPKQMKTFIESNTGFKSRFDKTFLFENCSPEPLIIVAQHLLHKEGLKPSDSARKHIISHLTSLYGSRDKHFGNARAVRQMVGDVVKHQNLRLAGIEPAMRTEEELATLSLEDIMHMDVQLAEQKQNLG
jgi:hypothetical protein